MAQRKQKSGKGSDNQLSLQEQRLLVRKLIDYGNKFRKVPGMSISPVGLAPSAQRVVLSYTRRTTATSTSGSTALQVFSGNGLFDPDITGAGNQPLGFDQWSAFYTRYRCLASAIEVNITTPAASTNGGIIMNTVVLPTTRVSTLTDVDAASSQPYALERVVNGVSGGPGPFRPLTSSMQSNVIWGVSQEAILSDDTRAALISANPADQWYWHIYTRPADDASTTTVDMVVKLHYLVDFFDREVLSQSVFLPENGLGTDGPQRCVCEKTCCCSAASDHARMVSKPTPGAVASDKKRK